MYFLSPVFLLMSLSTAELLFDSLKERDQVRCISAHAASEKGAGGKKGVSP